MTKTSPSNLSRLLGVHAVETVNGLGWSGVSNGQLLLRMRGRFDVLVTMDRKLPQQQNLEIHPFGVVLILARSNRMVDLRPLLTELLVALDGISPGELRQVGA